MEELTLSQAVERYGTEKQKKSLSEGKKWRKESNQNLIKTLQQHFEVVKEGKRGRNKIFIVDKPYDEVKAREDKRKDNGAKIPYEHELNSLVLNFILDKCKNRFVSMSPSQWLFKIGLVDERIIAASRNDQVVLHHLELLKKRYNHKFTDGNLPFLEHFIMTELNRLKNNLKRVFTKLSDAKIIRHKKEMYGCRLDNEHKPLTNKELTKVTAIERALYDKHNVKLQDLTFKKGDAITKFKEEFESCLREIGFRYIYESHACLVRVSDKMIKEYIDKLTKRNELVISYGLNKDDIYCMVHDFKDSNSNHSLDLAGKRQNKDRITGNRHIQQLKLFEEYLPMWELLLIFYEMTNYINPKMFSVEDIYNDSFDSDLFH